MLRNLLIRLVDTLPTLLLVLTLVFVAMRILPGDPAVAVLGDAAAPGQLEIYREKMGLNVPLWQQYFNFLGGVLTLNLGNSYQTGQPVLQMIWRALPYTIELTIVAVLLGSIVGIPLGVIAARRRNKAPDTTVRIFSLVGYAVPDFYLAALLLIAFALNLKWFPLNGGGDPNLVSQLQHVFLPAATLALVKAAFLGRLTRTSVLDVYSKDYVRTARAKGASENRVTYRHALRNALLPIATGLGLSTLATLSGSVAVELVFNRPGIGRLLIEAIRQRDYAVIQGGVLVFAIFVVIINLLMDLVYVLIDPRVKVT
jgi:peptide/nickel transport system permease protein